MQGLGIHRHLAITETAKVNMSGFGGVFTSAARH